jgi:hypothetical protein
MKRTLRPGLYTVDDLSRPFGITDVVVKQPRTVELVPSPVTGLMVARLETGLYIQVSRSNLEKVN